MRNDTIKKLDELTVSAIYVVRKIYWWTIIITDAREKKEHG